MAAMLATNMEINTYQPKRVLYQWASMDMSRSHEEVELVMAKNTTNNNANTWLRLKYFKSGSRSLFKDNCLILWLRNIHPAK